ncbi:MAG: MFS transporter, partial [Desulfovibrio sp.]|nr:MFS transporter [Desulfovibrio sp.]
MKLSGFQRERLACAWFFGCIGLIYGIFTGRLPALKAMTQANDAQIGFLLLAFGIAGFCGLLTSGLIIERFGPKLIAATTTLFATVALILASLAFSYWYLVAFCLIAGLGNGLCDVAMNAQGMAIERRHGRLCMSSLHASFSLGGVLGSLSGSLFAALGLSPFPNFLIVALAYFAFWPWACRNTLKGEKQKKTAASPKNRIPAAVYFLGLMAMLCYVSEGSVGEWGSVLLHSVKNASQQEAALVFACFSTTMVAGRFFGDRARATFGEFPLI